MPDDLREAVSRWLGAERSEDEGRAEAALAAVFETLPPVAVSPALTGRIVQAARAATVGADRTALRPGWRRPAQIASGIGAGAVIAYLGIRVLLPLLVTGFVKLVGGLLDGVLWMSVGLSAGLDIWTMLARAGRLVGAALATPKVAVTLVVIEAVGGVALYLIQRLLTSEKESSR